MERVCPHCGKSFRHIRAVFCSERCRRSYQDERRKRERAEAKAAGVGLVIHFCPVCGVPYRGTVDQEGRACSRCCRKVKDVRRACLLPRVEHKPNYILAAALFPQRDPWQVDNLTEEEREAITSNCLQDGGQAMAEGIDLIEYYKNRIEAAYSAGFEQWMQKLMEEPDTAEQKEGGEG